MNLASTLTLYSNHKLQGKTVFQGLPISIENKKGSVRHGGDDKYGKWSTKMRRDYGYVRGTTGLDGDGVDVFLGDNPNAKFAYVVHVTRQPDFKALDEDKVLLGFNSASEAKACFLQHYDDSRFFGGMDAIPMEEFKKKVLATKSKSQKLDGSKLEGAIEFERMMAGGPGSGCKGPGCGRPKNPISGLAPGMVGILTPKDDVDTSKAYQHLILINRAGYKDYKDFFNAGGVRFGVDDKNEGFVEVGAKTKDALDKAIKVIHALPTMQMLFELIPYGGKEGYKDALKNSFFARGSEKEVVSQIRAWWSKQNHTEELEADVGEPGVYDGGYGHIEPNMSRTSPPSLKKPYYVPSPTDPRETDDKYGDVTKRNSAATKARRDALTRQHTDANMKPLSSTHVSGFPSGTIGGFG